VDDTVAYTGKTPTKPQTQSTVYAFSGWDHEIVPVTGDATYTALFSNEPRKYTITWKNDDGTLIQTNADVEYGTNLFSIKPADPAKPTPDILKDYVFNGWVPESGSSVVVGENDIVVAEADEFDRSFLQLHPEKAVITAMDPDHLDIYGTLEAYQQAFRDFASQVSKLLIVKAGLPLSAASPQAMYAAERSSGAEYMVNDLSYWRLATKVRFVVPGEAMTWRTPCAFSAAMESGCSTRPLRQCCSQGCGQILPTDAGSGIFSLMIWTAPRKSPCAIFFKYP
jgi:hypothetical protein